MTYSDPSPQHALSDSTKRQLISAAHDAGLGDIINAKTLEQKGSGGIVTLTSATARAFATWLTEIAAALGMNPITATVVATTEDVSTDAWLRDTTDGIVSIPVGYQIATFPNPQKPNHSSDDNS